MSSIYLENYLKSVEELPEDLAENFGSIEELNSITRSFIKESNALKRQLFSSMKTPQEKKSKYDDPLELDPLGMTSEQMSDQKFELATETYDMIDDHIKSLESNLIQFENEVREDYIAMQEVMNMEEDENKEEEKEKNWDGDKPCQPDEPPQPPPPPPPPPSQTMPVPPPQLPKPPPKVMPSKKRGRSRPRNIKLEIENIPPSYFSNNIPVTSPDMPHITADKIFNYNSFFSFTQMYDMHIDSKELPYCFRHQVSFGNMIGCDSPIEPYQAPWRLDLS